MYMLNEVRKSVLRLGFAGLVLLSTATVFAQQVSTIPVAKSEAWIKRAHATAKRAQMGGWELVFLGDSITDFWTSKGREAWARFFGDYKALNLGVSGDCTEHLLWRLDNGQLDNYQPKLFVLMIGTNNTGHRKLSDESAQDTVDGIKAVLDRLEIKTPETPVLLLAIFPRGKEPTNQARVRNEAINAELPKLADDKRVFFMNINDKLMEPDGTLSREILGDFLHLTAKGYEIWGEAIAPFVEKTIGPQKPDAARDEAKVN